MTKRQKRLFVIVVILAVILALLGAYYAYYRATNKLTFDLVADVSSEVIDPPQFLYAFGGQAPNRLVRPTGIMVHEGLVYVPDAESGKVQVFTERGQWQRAIGGDEAITPLYIARNPKDGNLYVSDRRKRAVHIYTPAGKYLGDFDPRLPKSELPTFETGGVEWVPLALGFGRDGTLYATDILKGHRLLIFAPDGSFKRSIGTAAIVLEPSQAPGVFQFPNGLTVRGNEVYVVDSNNRRVQVFDLGGEFKRLVVTQGLPRGAAFLRPLPRDDASSTARFVTVDTLAHDATIWTQKGAKLLNFGEQGVLDGQFNYPTAVAVGTRNLMFITDTANARVQVWGWPDQAASVPGVGSPSRLAWCLTPLLLLPLLLLRKRRYFATADFVAQMVQREQEDLITSKRRVRWITSEGQPDLMRQLGVEQELADIFEVWKHSEADAKALVDKEEVSLEEAIILAVAQRSRLLCTEDVSLLRVAARIEVDAVDAEQFVERSRGGRRKKGV